MIRLKPTTAPSVSKVHLAIVTVIVLVAIVVVFFGGQSPTGYLTADEINTAEVETDIEGLVVSEEHAAPETTFRPEHCLEEKCVEPKVFAKLPEYPKDLEVVAILLSSSKLQTPIEFTEGVPDENYYKQPEFYPRFDEKGVPYFINPPTDRWGAFGFGVYPSDITLTVESGSEFDAYSFVRSGWFVETYQGMSLDMVFPSHAEIGIGDMVVDQDPEEVKNYFDVAITPKVVLLEPSFPVFEPGWAQRFEVNVKVSPDTPAGEYVIGVDNSAPPVEHSDMWLKRYKLKYTPIGMHSLGRPGYQIFLRVTE